MTALKSLPLSFDFGPDGACYVVNASAKKLQVLAEGALSDFAVLAA